MRKKGLLIGVILGVLAITGGIFAYTYTTAAVTIGVTAPESDFAEITTGTPAAPTVFGKFTGTWPSGNLFKIAPSGNYTGDLVIKVYLVNTGELIRYYHHLNLALELKDSAATPINADEQGIVQVLNLQNAEVQFYWANGTGIQPLKVEITGGGFRLHHWKTLTGGSVQPQIWCEVTQR